MRRLLLAADVIGLMSAFLLALAIGPTTAVADRVDVRWEIALFAASLPLWVFLARAHSLYDRDEERSDHSTVDDIFGVFQVVTIGTWSFLAITHLAGLPHPTLPRLVIFWLTAVVLVPLLRAATRIVGRRHPAYVQNVIIVGSGDVAQLLDGKIRQHPEYRLKVVGFVDGSNGISSNGAGHPELIGRTDDLPRARSGPFRASRRDRLLGGLGRANPRGDSRAPGLQRPGRHRAATVRGAGNERAAPHDRGCPACRAPDPSPVTLVEVPQAIVRPRRCDSGLIFLAPLIAVTALCIKLDSRGPVFFRQVRMGAGERPFRVFKFRTMVDDAETLKSDVAHLNMHVNDDPRMFKVPNDPRVTRVGAFLRRSRIDELPQLFNVISGEMSLVGPRPLILDEDQYVVRWARCRLKLKPGMTGLWQVLGASDIPFDEMTKLDYLYVTNWSLREDLRLILLTLPALARARAAY